jgi:ATP-dependent HslUV protease subunit HslV
VILIKGILPSANGLLIQARSRRLDMTTIAVVKKESVAAIAADSLTTWGSAKDSAEYIANHNKILHVGQSYIAISGPTSAKLAIEDYFAGRPDVDLTAVDAIFRAWLSLHTDLKDGYFLNPNENKNDAFESTRIEALIANSKGIFGVSAHRSVQQFSKFYAYGTGWQIAIGAMYAAYSQPGRSAEDIARCGIEAAAEFDVDTGLPVVCYTVPSA